MGEFLNKNILITGASSGIGKAIAKHMSDLGAAVVLTSRDENKLKAVKRELSGPAYVFPCDLEDLTQIKNIFIFCQENGLKLNGLVHSSGVCPVSPIRANQIEDARMAMNVNTLSFIELGKYFSLRKYTSADSSAVAISSYATTKPSPGQSIYAASKAALESFVRVMAKEIASKGMRVNAICPAMVNTQMYLEHEKSLPAEAILQSQPLGLIEPNYIAYLTEFLLSEKAKYITGACIPVSAAG